jgi:hypothetical protein
MKLSTQDVDEPVADIGRAGAQEDNREPIKRLCPAPLQAVAPDQQPGDCDQRRERKHEPELQPLGPEIAEHRAEGARREHRQPEGRRWVERARLEARSDSRVRYLFRIHDRASGSSANRQSVPHCETTIRVD